VSTIHQNGTKVVAQLNHAGCAAKIPVVSVVSSRHIPKEMTQSDIDKVIMVLSVRQGGPSWLVLMVWKSIPHMGIC